MPTCQPGSFWSCLWWFCYFLFVTCFSFGRFFVGVVVAAVGGLVNHACAMAKLSLSCFVWLFQVCLFGYPVLAAAVESVDPFCWEPCQLVCFTVVCFALDLFRFDKIVIIYIGVVYDPCIRVFTGIPCSRLSFGVLCIIIVVLGCRGWICRSCCREACSLSVTSLIAWAAPCHRRCHRCLQFSSQDFKIMQHPRSMNTRVHTITKAAGVS